MDVRVLIGVVLFTFALIVYSIATWAGVVSGKLKKWHLSLFWFGLAADISGTFIIGSIHGGFVMNTHSYLGAVAIIAILVQNIFSTKILLGENKKWIATLPKKVFLPVWILWILSYITGLVLSGGSH